MSISLNSSSRRLVTQNLLVSAVSHEVGSRTNWRSVHDLSVLIETFCLYDEIVVLGRQAYSMLKELGDRSEIFNAVDKIARIEQPASDAQLVNAACGHLGAFFNGKVETSRFQPLIESLFEPDWVARAFTPNPDQVADFEFGEEWVRTVPNKSNILNALEQDAEFHRSATFVLRTFLYLAYADINRVSLTPDGTRARILEPIVRSEKKLRKLLLAKMEEQFQKNYLEDDEVRRNISPLASVVFDRSGSKPTNIAEEMLRLRRELTPLRDRLRDIEVSLEGASRETELKVIGKWKRVFQEIEQAYGDGAGFVSLEGALTFAEAAGKFAAKPQNPSTWLKPLALPVDTIRKMFARRPIIEIHRLQFPSTTKLQATARKLFGDLTDDPKSQ